MKSLRDRNLLLAATAAVLFAAAAAAAWLVSAGTTSADGGVAVSAPEIAGQDGREGPAETPGTAAARAPAARRSAGDARAEIDPVRIRARFFRHEDGLPLAGATLEIGPVPPPAYRAEPEASAPAPAVRRSAPSGTDGRVELVVPDWPLELQKALVRYGAPARTRRAREADRRRIEFDGILDLGDVRLAEAAQVRGRVVSLRAVDGEPLECAVWAGALSPEAESWPEFPVFGSGFEVSPWRPERALSGPDGRFAIDGLPIRDDLVLLFCLQGHARRALRIGRLDPRAPVELGDVELRPLPDDTAVRGVVLDHAGDPVGETHVAVHPGESLESRAWDTTRTDADGRFVLRGVGGRRYALGVGSTEYDRDRPVVATAGGAAVTVRLDPPRPDPAYTVDTSQLPTLEGVVTDAAGRPVEGARVHYHEVTPDWVTMPGTERVEKGSPSFPDYQVEAFVAQGRQRATTGADGRFVLLGKPPGFLHAQHPTGLGDLPLRWLHTAGRDTTGLTVVLRPAGRIAGRVVTTAAGPDAAVGTWSETLRVVGECGLPKLVEIGSASPRFEVGGLWPGTWTVDNGRGPGQRVEVRAGETAAVVIDRGLTLTGELDLAALGIPVWNASAAGCSAEVPAVGRFELPGLPRGRELRLVLRGRAPSGALLTLQQSGTASHRTLRITTAAEFAAPAQPALGRWNLHGRAPRRHGWSLSVDDLAAGATVLVRPGPYHVLHDHGHVETTTVETSPGDRFELGSLPLRRPVEAR